MGKSKNTVVGESQSFDQVTIDRIFFKDAIEKGISAAQVADPDYPLPITELRRVAATATEMDALAWKCRGSCGCPMTYAGVVMVLPDDGENTGAGVAGAPSAFASTYDDVIADHVTGSYGDALKLTIVD